MSQLGWQILAALAEPDEPRMLFVDDIHGVDELHPIEKMHPVVSFEPKPEPTHYLVESDMMADADVVLGRLTDTALPRHKRASRSGGQWKCAGFPLTDNAGRPLCLLLDLGLTWRKQTLGFTQGVNILPWYYERQQRRLVKLARRAVPEFTLSTILFDGSGRHWSVADEPRVSGRHQAAKAA